MSTSKYYQEAFEEYQDAKNDPDAWDKRIVDTGCYVENMALQLCHADTGDWRQCAQEMDLFRKCWVQQGGKERVRTVDRN